MPYWWELIAEFEPHPHRVWSLACMAASLPCVSAAVTRNPADTTRKSFIKREDSAKDDTYKWDWGHTKPSQTKGHCSLHPDCPCKAKNTFQRTEKHISLNTLVHTKPQFRKMPDPPPDSSHENENVPADFFSVMYRDTWASRCQKARRQMSRQPLRAEHLYQDIFSFSSDTSSLHDPEPFKIHRYNTFSPAIPVIFTTMLPLTATAHCEVCVQSPL